MRVEVDLFFLDSRFQYISEIKKQPANSISILQQSLNRFLPFRLCYTVLLLVFRDATLKKQLHYVTNSETFLLADVVYLLYNLLTAHKTRNVPNRVRQLSVLTCLWQPSLVLVASGAEFLE